MGYKTKIKCLFVGSLTTFVITLVAGIIFTKKYTEIRALGYNLAHSIDNSIQTLGFFTLALIVLSLILFFLREQVFHSWVKFTKWYLPIALLLILISSDTGGGLFIGFGGGYDREGMIWFTTGLFLVISLLIIIIKSWRLRK